MSLCGYLIFRNYVCTSLTGDVEGAAIAELFSVTTTLRELDLSGCRITNEVCALPVTPHTSYTRTPCTHTIPHTYIHRYTYLSHTRTLHTLTHYICTYTSHFIKAATPLALLRKIHDTQSGVCHFNRFRQGASVLFSVAMRNKPLLRLDLSDNEIDSIRSISFAVATVCVVLWRHAQLRSPTAPFQSSLRRARKRKYAFAGLICT